MANGETVDETKADSSEYEIGLRSVVLAGILIVVVALLLGWWIRRDGQNTPPQYVTALIRVLIGLGGLAGYLGYMKPGNRFEALRLPVGSVRAVLALGVLRRS